MTLTIPVAGLDEIRRAWSGRGGLWAAVAAVHDDDGEPWAPALARRRARRVAAELLRPHLALWPASTRGWLDALPAQSVRRRLITDIPGAGVDWPATRRAGWPPVEFHHRRRSRVADTTLMAVTRWTIEELARAVTDIDRFDSEIVGEVARRRVDVATKMLDREPLASSPVAVPSRPDLSALRASGRPWGSVAAVADWLRVIDHDPARIATLPIDPDPALADRLFHVAVLGSLIRGLRELGWAVEVTGLPGAPDGRPQFALTDTTGTRWDLWFEMAGAWTHYGVPSPYSPAVAGIAGTGSPLGADIALIDGSNRAVLIECKYSADPTYVGRNGYEQTLAYMAEARTGLVTAAAGVVVGPTEIVSRTGRTVLGVGPVVVTSTGDLAAEVARAAADVAALIVT